MSKVRNWRLVGNPWSRVLPWALLTSGLVSNLFSPPTITFTPIYSAAPLVASALLSFRATVVNAVATVVGLSTLLLVRAPQEPPWERGAKILTVVTVAGIAVGINVVLERRERQLSSVRNTAEVVQRAIVPEPPSQMGAISIAHRYRASGRNELVGGDFYAVVESPFGIRAILGDVRGKGLPATESVNVVLGAFRECAEYVSDLHTLAGRLDAALGRHARQSRALEKLENFVTVVVVQVNLGRPGESPRLRLINRGHPPPLLLTPEREVHLLGPVAPSLPLGVELGGEPAGSSVVEYPRGSTLLLYTDGLTEARDVRGRFYDPVLRLSGSVFDGPDALLDWLAQDVTRYARDVDDDMALLALSCSEQESCTAEGGVVRPETVSDGGVRRSSGAEH